MKLLTIIIISILSFHCKQRINENAIIGSWTTMTDPKYSDHASTDSLVFTKPDILIIYWKTGHTIEDTLRANFQVHDNQLILTRPDTTYIFDIIELDDKKMATKKTGQNSIFRYIRLR
jgi:hypothetical protein